MENLLIPKKVGDAPVVGCNDAGVCFLGELDSSFLTYSVISSHFNVTEGSLNTTSEANKWLHFTLDDKELMVSKVAIRSSISWDQLYSKGLVYGTDDTGFYPTGTPTNQYRTITLNGKTYKARLLKGCDDGMDPFTNITGWDLAGTQQSEWSRLFYPIIVDDPNISSYTGPMLASYTEADLQMRWVDASTTSGGYNWCQERHLGDTTWRVIRGIYGPSTLSRGTSSLVNATSGWRCVLELVG